MNNGVVYSGEWKKGHKHGLGLYVWANGEQYEGEWSKDKQHGKGIEMHVGNVYDGEWRDGMKNGHGKEMLANGAVFEAYFRNGQKTRVFKHKEPVVGVGIRERLWKQMKK